jgi:hypothetical protein
MDGIQLVVFLIRCSEGLLLCEDLSNEHLQFSSTAICQASIPYLLEEAYSSGAAGSVVMAKCRYLLKKHNRYDKMITLKKSYQLSGVLNEQKDRN